MDGDIPQPPSLFNYKITMRKRQKGSMKRIITRFIKQAKSPSKIPEWCILDKESQKVTISVIKLLRIIGVPETKLNRDYAIDALSEYFESHDIDLES